MGTLCSCPPTWRASWECQPCAGPGLLAPTGENQTSPEPSPRVSVLTSGEVNVGRPGCPLTSSPSPRRGLCTWRNRGSSGKDLRGRETALPRCTCRHAVAPREQPHGLDKPLCLPRWEPGPWGGGGGAAPGGAGWPGSRGGRGEHTRREPGMSSLAHRVLLSLPFSLEEELLPQPCRVTGRTWGQTGGRLATWATRLWVSISRG